MASSPSLSLAFSRFVVFFFSISIASSKALQYDNLPEEKMTHLHFYFHEIVSGLNETSFVVASLGKSSSGFGNIRVFDNALREGPEPSSKLVGRAQGMSVVTSSSGQQSVMAEINFVFTTGEFNGSSISTFGTIQAAPVDQTIVGGNGRFRMARGYATRKLVKATASAYVVEFEIYVMH